MFIIQALMPYKRFREGLIYSESTLQAYQRDFRDNVLTLFPLDIDDIAVTIDERSENYTIGNNTSGPRVMDPYAKSIVQVIESNSAPIVSAMGQARKNNGKKDDASYNTQTCKAYINNGH